MREILFRGKSNGGCCWVYGYYAVLNDGYRPDEKRHYILAGELRYNDQYGNEDMRKVEIDPDTLCQYTGLKGRNGKIFEGDIVQGKNILHENRTKYEVAFDDGMFCLVDDHGTSWHHSHIDGKVVIGNIHDNPELMGGVSDENA